MDRQSAFQKSSFDIPKRLACTLNANALQSRKESVHKIARQEIEGFTRLLDTYIITITSADLSGEEIYNYLTLLSWYIHRFCKSLLRHIFPATKQIAKAFSQIVPKLPVTLHYIYDPKWIPQNFINIPEKPSEINQKLAINDQSIEIKNYNAGNQPFTCTNIPKNTNTSLEASPTENMETIIHSKQTDTRLNETTEKDFNSTLIEDGTLFSSHAVHTLIDLENNEQNNNETDKLNVTTNTTDNTHIYQNQQNRHTINSTELTQSSDPLNTTLPLLPNMNSSLPRLHRQSSVHSNTEPVTLINSTQQPQVANQNIQITPQQLVKIVRQLNSQNAQQTTNAPTHYFLQAASTPTPSPVIRQNIQMIYPLLGGSVPMQQSLRPSDGTDLTYTTEDFLNAITSNMVTTAAPEQTVSPYHKA